MISRRKFLRLSAASLAVGAGGGFSWARWGETRRLQCITRSVPLGLSGPVRVLHASDFHASDVVPLEFIRSSLFQGLEMKPDLVCLTGDYVTGKIEDEPAYRDILKELSSKVPVLATLGNHDGGAWVKYRGGYADTTPIRKFLHDAGVDCLVNESRQFTIRGNELRFVGLGDAWAQEFKPENAFSSTALFSDPKTVVLSHNPDTKDQLTPFAWNLLLSGHTHGGQVVLPFLGTNFAPVRDARYISGLHAWNNRWIHITHGIGNLHGIRFNCPPDVTLLELV